MLGGADALFQSIKSIKTVCYAASEVTDAHLQRLLRELPGAGVCLVELDAWEQAHGAASSLAQMTAEPECALLLAGSVRTLALAFPTKAATVGFGALLLEQAGAAADILVEGFEEVDVQFLDRIMKRAQGLPWVTAVTKRTFLREITLEDLDALYALYAQPGITDYLEPLYEEREKEEQYTRDYIANMYRFYGYGMWLVCDRTSGALIGRAGFSHQDIGEACVLEMGYVIGVPYQRQGYATEVCEKLLAFAREHLSDFETLNCFIEPENKASRALVARLGFEHAGEVKLAGKTMLRYTVALV